MHRLFIGVKPEPVVLPPTPSTFLFSENGDFLLQEDGDKILLEENE